MKPKSIVLKSAGLFLICLAVACGEGRDYSENKKEAPKEEEYSETTADKASAAYEEEAPVTEEAMAEKDAEGGLKNDSPFDASKKQGLDEVFSSSAAMVDPNDTIHKFVRTGDIRFKVKNVAHATYKIEDITRKFNGFVTYTSLNSRIDETSRRKISEDSILLTTYYTVENTITIRVPAKNLDTTLKEISQFVSYLDYRNLNANDVRLQILSNKLEKIRLDRYNQRMSNISNSGNANYMDDKAYIEENILQKQAEKDQSLIEDLSLEDQIEYATITLSIYQNEEAIHEMIANEENIDDYRPSVGSRLTESLKAGWYFIEDVFVGLVAAWPLWLILTVLYIILRKNGYLKRKKSE
jgi:hypothetical protein